ncbi:hypothetical protein KHQ08_06945 [Pseudochrobactrum algeriensis]|uniref:hypothetical protein n=1 Tax=Pseudochrobactrum algeriensis TaxID=2834768 RepID=UPI001BCA765D|nr:hypothetical protein [Pseudochrobactrum algeriensis]QVQ37752.1 hypothetical protein KHQ08_06945 [Pseudochrobactrum algeriensis]QVQ40972.1 hypothetical protein KHQ07_05245 [Pseudochrobactrum algeriensis]QVQ44896.1 hypothetical protein KHQ09_07210 [Pseudochrobactrum algeriensis]
MTTALQSPHTDLTGTFSVKAKPVMKARDTSMQALAMIKAHEFYASERKRLAKRISNKTKPAPAFNMQDFGRHLSAAWRYVKALKAKAAWESKASSTTVMDEATFQSCRTDGALRAA